MDVKLGLSLREEHTLRVFENRVQRRIFAPQGEEITKVGENVIMRSLKI
jgi:hypothetical protein